MPNCCYPEEYARLFSDRTARRTVRHYRRRGLRGSAGQLADAVAATGIDGATILEVGGGVGEIHTDLLRRGGVSATNVELSPNWEDAAGKLLAELDLRERVQRRVGDFVDMAADLPEVDIVLLHRVICCYPHWRALLGAAASRARRVVGVTVPVERLASRAAVRVGNALLRWQGRSFRAYVHPPGRMIQVLAAGGFELAADRSGLVWRTFAAKRPTAALSPDGDLDVPDEREPAV